MSNEPVPERAGHRAGNLDISAFIPPPPSVSVAAAPGMNNAPASGEPLIRVRLVPVEVFGADEENCDGCGATIQFGYGLCDAVQAWSDCNRAIGHVYRVDEEDNQSFRTPGDTITIYVPQSEMAKFAKRFGDSYTDRCPSCHVEYRDLPEGHVVQRPVCRIGQVAGSVVP